MLSPVTVKPSVKYSITGNGLAVRGDLTEAEWEACGRKLGMLHSATMWAIGDWLVYGLGRGEWGASYDRAVEITGKSFDSLGQYYATSKAFPPKTRNYRVAWGWYREARSLPEAERGKALALAVSNHWNRSDFGQYIASRNTACVDEYQATPPARPDPRIARKVNRAIGHRKERAKQMRAEHMYCPHCGERITKWVPLTSKREHAA